jgi:hypothetical protein
LTEDELQLLLDNNDYNVVDNNNRTDVLCEDEEKINHKKRRSQVIAKITFCQHANSMLFQALNEKDFLKASQHLQLMLNASSNRCEEKNEENFNGKKDVCLQWNQSTLHDDDDAGFYASLWNACDCTVNFLFFVLQKKFEPEKNVEKKSQEAVVVNGENFVLKNNFSLQKIVHDFEDLYHFLVVEEKNEKKNFSALHMPAIFCVQDDNLTKTLLPLDPKWLKRVSVFVRTLASWLPLFFQLLLNKKTVNVVVSNNNTSGTLHDDVANENMKNINNRRSDEFEVFYSRCESIEKKMCSTNDENFHSNAVQLIADIFTFITGFFF